MVRSRLVVRHLPGLLHIEHVALCRGLCQPNCLPKVLSMITGMQIKMARSGLGWTASELAVKAEVAVNTVRRFEIGKGAHTGSVSAIQRALEAAGVEFVNQGKRIGVMIDAEEQDA